MFLMVLVEGVGFVLVSDHFVVEVVVIFAHREDHDDGDVGGDVVLICMMFIK